MDLREESNCCPEIGGIPVNLLSEGTVFMEEMTALVRKSHGMSVLLPKTSYILDYSNKCLLLKNLLSVI